MQEWIRAAVLAVGLVGGAIWAIAQSDALRTPWRVDREALAPMPSSPVPSPAQSRAVVSVPASIAPAVPPAAPESLDSLRARCVNEVRGVGSQSGACERFDALVRSQTAAAPRKPAPPPMMTTAQPVPRQSAVPYYGEEPGKSCGFLYPKGSISYRQCRAEVKTQLDRHCAKLTQQLEWLSGAQREGLREAQRQTCYWASVYQPVES